ncbi:MAG TPA: autotransporter-associated beta strand repeat-containing protein, partial [Opitutus sp.]|nr:autotransporter-associated beta strand repeat-containing protein [Opitutus sp.]
RTLTVNQSADGTFAGVIQGSGGGLMKNGSGTLTLSGANTYTGGTTVSAGTLALGGSERLADAGALTVSGGTFDLGAFNETVGAVALSSGSITGSGGTLTGSSYAVQAGGISANLGGSGALTKSGSGTVVLTGVNSYSGGTAVTGGLLEISSDAALGTGALLLAGGGIKYGAAFDNLRAWSPGGSGAVIDTNGFDVTYAGDGITGNTYFTKQGAGTLTLTGTHDFTGGFTSINEGTLQLGDSGHVLPDATAVVINAGTFALGAADETIGSLVGYGGTHVTLTSGHALTINETSDTTFSGVIAGSGGAIVKAGAGTLTLGGTSTYDGGTTVSAGTLLLGNTGTILADTGAVTVNGGTLALGAADETIGSLAGTGGTIELFNGAGHSLTVNQSADGTFGGVIHGTGGALVKNGGGTLELTGVNTYTGATTVNAGMLVVNGSAAASTFTVNAGGTLGGSGTVGPLTIASGGTLAPGNSPGTLSAGDTTFGSGGTFQLQVNDATGAAGTNYDLLDISGTLTLTATAGNPFVIDLTSLTSENASGLADHFDSAGAYSFMFVTTSGGITGFSADKFLIDTANFANPFSGTWSIASDGSNLTLNYGLTAVPEPATYAALLGLGALAFAAARKRRAAR